MHDAASTHGTGHMIDDLAEEVARARDDRPAAGHDAHEACANCGARRHGPYCHACGQAGHVHRHLGALVHDLAHGVFHFEGKLWATLPLLAWRPGELTRRYVAGERAKFVSPMALFLFSVFLLFALVPHLAGHERAARPRTVADRRAALETRIATYRSLSPTLLTPDARARMRARIAEAQSALAALDSPPAARVAVHEPEKRGDGDGDDLRAAVARIDTGVPFLDYAIRHAAENPALTAYKLKSYGYKYSWMLIPISVPFVWLLFAFRRDVGGYDHAIFAIYSLSFMSLALIAVLAAQRAGLPDGLGALLILGVPPVHMYRQLKGAYRLGRLSTLWRTAALLAITLVTSLLFLAFLLYMQSE